MNKRHGGPYDRGNADAFFRRKYMPHYYVRGSLQSPRVQKEDMTRKQIFAYATGYAITYVVVRLRRVYG